MAFPGAHQHCLLSSSKPGLLEAQSPSLGSSRSREGGLPFPPLSHEFVSRRVPLPLAFPFLLLVPSPPLYFLFSSPPICPSHIGLFWAEFLTVSVVGTVVQLLSLEDELCFGSLPRHLPCLARLHPPALTPS